MEGIFNFSLVSAILAIMVAQVLKVPIHYIRTKELNFGLLTSNGKMPSSHSAAVTALATSIGLIEGWDTPIFALAALFAIITMFDAKGYRRQAGEQAAIVNQLVKEFQNILSDLKKHPSLEVFKHREELKELLGHKPIEVFFGALTGICTSISLYLLIT